MGFPLALKERREAATRRPRGLIRHLFAARSTVDDWHGPKCLFNDRVQAIFTSTNTPLVGCRFMVIVIQIPCLNEGTTIGPTITDVLRHTTHLGDVRILVIDDGSTDDTVDQAWAAGADYVVRHGVNRGLAEAYMTGLSFALSLGAEIIVNTDADNQYDAAGISALLAPLRAGEADVVVGARPIEAIAHFSPVKKRLQRLGTAILRKLSRTDVVDATSGFRAITKEAALRLNSFTDYTYTLETLIQAGLNGLRVCSVPITCNPPTRSSRLMRNMRSYVWRSARDMLRLTVVYAPLRSYLILSAAPLLAALLLGLRYLVLVMFVDPARSHTPSLILMAVLGVLGFLIVALGMIGEMLSVNRRLLEDQQVMERRRAVQSGELLPRVPIERLSPPPHFGAGGEREPDKVGGGA